MHPKFPYDAVITEEGHWTWQPEHYHPPCLIDNSTKPAKQRPQLKAGDFIRIRLAGCGPECQGPHTLTFKNKSVIGSQSSPFEEPHQESTVTYDQPWAVMFRIAEKEGSRFLWQFNIECGTRHKSFDPEFHVGTGPADPGST